MTLAGSTNIQTLNIPDGTLIVNGQNLVTTNLTTLGTGLGGLLKMTNIADSVAVAGNLHIGGVRNTAGLMSAGSLVVYGNIVTDTGFSASGTHKTWMASASGQTITMNSPSLIAGFQDLIIETGNTVTLATDAIVQGTLAKVEVVPATAVITGGLTHRTLTAKGLNVPTGTYPLNFTNVTLNYADGILADITFNNVTFQGFGPSYNGTMLQFNRTTGTTYAFTNLTFIGTLLDFSGHYISNTGTKPLTLIGPNPNSTAALSVCGCTLLNYFSPGTSSIVWP